LWKTVDFCGSDVDALYQSQVKSQRLRDIENYLTNFIPCPEGGSAVNKNDLISSVAADSGLSKADATKAVDAVFDSIEKSLKSGNEVRLVGFGTFSVADRKASTGRNPRTGESIQIPASKQPKFKAGKGLKEAVN
jgi:DNA-binding protein HU-beta